jgi:hypothetical protein
MKIQWDGKLSTLALLRDNGMEYSAALPQLTDTIARGLRVHTQAGPVSVKGGDWIIRDDDGNWRVERVVTP